MPYVYISSKSFFADGTEPGTGKVASQWSQWQHLLLPSFLLVSFSWGVLASIWFSIATGSKSMTCRRAAQSSLTCMTSSLRHLTRSIEREDHPIPFNLALYYPAAAARPSLRSCRLHARPVLAGPGYRQPIR